MPLSIRGAPLGVAEAADAHGFADSTQARQYAAHFDWLRSSPYVERPYQVGIEILASCNAACNFCPYPTMNRKGQRMSDALLAKILDELGGWDPDVAFEVNLARVNEPFLDKRSFDVLEFLGARVPQARAWIFTNASPLVPKLIDRVVSFANIAVFLISFNDHRADEYERVMRLPFDRVVKNIDALHAVARSSGLPFEPVVSRVGDGSAADADFLNWTRRRWPLFESRVTHRFDWMGSVSVERFGLVPNTGCWQWFHVPVLSSGRVTHCSIDAEGAHAWGDVNERSLVEAYNQPMRRALRERVLSRTEYATCANCNHFG
ncbi:MAG: radical SAM/SPASM domain-containing protein [Phycisphaerales bacterium]